MAIVETKIVSRPNTSIPFFNETDNAELVSFKAATGPYTFTTNTESYQRSTNVSGSVIIERTLSTDLLTQTNKVTFDSMSTWSTTDTCINVALDKEYFAYAEANGLTHPTGQYTLTGISSAFSCTTTYTFDSNIADSFFNIFTSSIEASDKLVSFTNTGTQLIAVHTYTNSADFTENHWKDNTFVAYLNENEITRTIAYAMI
jgi:hypothetical protein